MKRTILLVSLLAGVLVCLALAPLALATPLTPDWVVPPTGHRPAPGDLSYLKGVQAVPQSRVFKEYPASYDLRTLGRLTSVKNQGAYGTCWAFASLGSLESGLLASDPTVWDFSEDNLVWFSGFSLGGDVYQSGGNSFMALAYLARWGGPVLESQDGYADGSHPAGLAAQRHLNKVVFVPPRAAATDNDQIKAAVMNYGAVDVDIYWSDSYYKADTKAYRYTGSLSANHDVAIVGWDDGYAASNFVSAPPGPGAFIVRNSWGSGWGDGGYFYASYYDTKLGYGGYNMAFAAAGPNDDYLRAYQYDPLGYWPGDGPNTTTSTGWFANVFTATATEDLAAVGFYTPLPNCSYEVHTSATSGLPSFAGLQLRGAGTLTTAGYHVVTLPATVPLTSGQPFTVAVKLTAPDASFRDPIPAEVPYTGYSDNASSNPGESYVCLNGSTWQDITGISGYGEANVCLKTFTSSSAPPAPPVVIAPNGGEDWTIGSSHAITWSGAGAGTATIALSRDGGATWPETIVSGTANDGSHSWTVTGPETTDAMVRVTTSQGDDDSNGSFTISAAPPPPAGWSAQVSNTTQWLDAVAFADDQHGWAVGWDGTIVATSDGGSTWTPQTSGTTSDLKGVAFANPLTGWAVGDGGKLLATITGGATWSPRSSGTTWDLDDVEALSPTTAVAVGLDGVFKTTDGGSTWKHPTAGLGDADWLRGVDFMSPDYGWAVGWSGTVVRTTNGGTTWTKQNSGVDVDLESVCFLDSQRGWAVGWGGTVIGTTDGGVTWSLVGVPTSQDLNDIVFVGAELGWIVGYSGTVLTTTDGGTTWIAETAPGSPWLRSAAFTSETCGWAVGLSGKIVHLAPGPGDVTPPHTVLTGADDRWRRSPLPLSLAATDPSGVQRTEARIDGGSWLLGSSFVVDAPSTHENDGLHRVDYRSVDTLDNVESYHSTEVRIDTRRPTTKAPSKASVRRYQYVRLYYKVVDTAPNAGTATVTIKIKTLGGATKKTIKLGAKAVNKSLSYRFKCTLAKRTYRFYVYATDPAGNTQSKIGRNYLYVKQAAGRRALPRGALRTGSGCAAAPSSTSPWAAGRTRG